jgi:hypothetical protein
MRASYQHNVDTQHASADLCKIYIADGFYRVWLLPANIPISKLGVVFSTEDGAEPLIGFPLALPMGWVNSPPYFTMATEMLCDLTNAGLTDKTVHLPHALDAISETTIPPEVALPPMSPPRCTIQRYQRPPMFQQPTNHNTQSPHMTSTSMTLYRWYKGSVK